MLLDNGHANIRGKTKVSDRLFMRVIDAWVLVCCDEGPLRGDAMLPPVFLQPRLLRGHASYHRPDPGADLHLNIELN